MMCFGGTDILVPRCEVEALKEEGAVCGSCSEVCCPGEVGKKIDMCLNGKTINVNRNACKGILTAGGTCGPCIEVIASKAVSSKKQPVES